MLVIAEDDQEALVSLLDRRTLAISLGGADRDADDRRRLLHRDVVGMDSPSGVMFHTAAVPGQGASTCARIVHHGPLSRREALKSGHTLPGSSQLRQGLV